MSPTPGPEATGAVPSPASQPAVRGGGDASQTTVNGTTTGVGVPSPGDGIQQTMVDACSGPSTSTAGPVPSPQLPQEAVDAAGQVVGPKVSAVGRAGGQVGGLGTAGDTYGAVSTTEVADASGVHGDATAVTQGFSVATESGMAIALRRMLPQASQGTTHLQRNLEAG